ncbi:MAG TPA: phage tail protein [Pyrinomonadaceae bacterium]|nr:phage tail protein [Pyrinomonadaceae bacterium]
MPVYRDDPYAGYNFEVVVTGISDDGKAVKGSFAECSGLEAAMDPIEYRNGSEDITVRKLPGLKKFTNITLKRGVTGDLAFWNWILQGMNGTIVRTEGSVLLLNEAKQEVMRWNFKRAWPVKCTQPSMNAKNNEVAMESVEICHEGLSVDGQAG